MQGLRTGTDEAGFALVITVMVVLIVGSLVAGAAVIGSNHLLVNRFYDRQSELESAADAGLEYARARLNSDRTLYPATGYNTLESEAAVTDGAGNVIPGVTRSIYVGPSGVTSGQYGVFGTILSVVTDEGGGRVIRRAQVYQESFSKYAYFTDIEPSNISFGSGDQIFGPVHSNSPIKIYSSGATFHGPVRTAQDVPSPQYGTFMQGYTEYVSAIAMPVTADLTRLKAQAVAGGTAVTSNTTGSSGTATTRIEFMAIDLNGDGDENDANEGFFRVYKSTDADWVTATVPNRQVDGSDQCGDFHGNNFVAAADHNANGNGHDAIAAVRSPSRRCYLGGADELWGRFEQTDSKGRWEPWGGVVSPLVAGRRDARYLWPITRELNPDFKGVIHVEGRVVVSGRLRGRVTVAATEDIIIGDDLVYVTDPGSGTCVDMMGLFAGDDVIMADNALNAPRQPTPQYDYLTYDDTSDEFVHATVLALDIFTNENHNQGSRNDEPCGSGVRGRGCLFLTGGIIQRTRGAIGTTNGTGHKKRYSYDQCGATAPPPYFPTTGYFARGQYYQVDPVGFEVGAFFDLITPGS